MTEEPILLPWAKRAAEAEARAQAAREFLEALYPHGFVAVGIDNDRTACDPDADMRFMCSLAPCCASEMLKFALDEVRNNYKGAK